MGLKLSGLVACVRVSALRLGYCRFHPWLSHTKAIKFGTQHLGLEFGGLDQTMIPKLLSVSQRVGGSNPEETVRIVWDVSVPINTEKTIQIASFTQRAKSLETLSRQNDTEI